MLKAAVVSPMPKLKATAAAAVCPGALASILNPYRISRQNELIENPPIRAPQVQRRAAPSSAVQRHARRPARLEVRRPARPAACPVTLRCGQEDSYKGRPGAGEPRGWRAGSERRLARS